MNELDDFKAIWKTQETGPGNSGKLDDSVSYLLEKQRKKIRRTNVMASLCAMVTSIYLITLMFRYSEEAPLFYFSISSIVLLMVVVLVVLWNRSLKSAQQISLDSQSYVHHQLKRLNRNRLIIQLSPVYGFLLGVCVNAYAYSLIQHASIQFVFWVTNINWAYIFLISYLSYTYKMRKFKKNMEPLIADLEKLKTNLDQGH